MIRKLYCSRLKRRSYTLHSYTGKYPPHPDASVDDRIILGLTVSLFLSVYVTAAALAVTVGYLIKKGMLGEIIRTVPRGKALVAFALLGAAVSLLRGNWVGLLASAGVLCVALVALYVRSIMTRPLLKRVIRTACVASILCLPVAIVQLALSGDPSFRRRRPLKIPTIMRLSWNSYFWFA